MSVQWLFVWILDGTLGAELAEVGVRVWDRVVEWHDFVTQLAVGSASHW